MKKLAILLVVLVVLGLGAFLFAERGVRAAVEEGGEYALGVETRLDDVGLGLFEGRVAMQGLAVDNPDGFPAHPLLSFGSIEAQMPPRNLLADVVEVERLVFRDAQLRLDVVELSTNVQAVLEHVQGVLGSGEPQDGGTPADPGAKRFLIRELRIDGGRAEIGIGAQSVGLDLPSFTLRDVDPDGLTIPEIAALLTRSLTDSALSVADDELPPELAASLKAATQGAALEDLVRGALDGADEKLGEALDEALDSDAKKVLDSIDDDTKKAAGKALDDLLGGKKD